MTNKFFVAGEERVARVQDLFAAVAPRYDLINDLQSFGLHRYWKRRVLALAAVHPGTRALDLCCGTGDIALALAREGAEVVGLDFSAPMLAVAQQRLENSCAQKNSSVQFLQGDAQHIPFPDASFDIVTIGYGLRNLANLDAGLREIQRVARPGARLLALDFGRPDNALWREIYFAYLGKFVPWMGRIFCGDPDTHSYILESLLHYAGQRGVAARMEALGLINTRIINFMGGVMSINYAEKPR